MFLETRQLFKTFKKSKFWKTFENPQVKVTVDRNDSITVDLRWQLFWENTIQTAKSNWPSFQKVLDIWQGYKNASTNQ